MGSSARKVATRKSLSVVLVTLAGVAILLLLISQIDLHKAKDLFLQTPPSVLILLFALLVLTNVLRAHRFYLAYGLQGLSLGLSISIVFVSNFLSSLLPARMGDFSYPLLLKRCLGVSYIEGISTLVVLRLLDLLAIGVIFLVSLAAIPSMPGSITTIVPFSVSLLLAVTTLLVLAIYAARHWRLPSKQSQRWRFKLFGTAMNFLSTALEALRTIDSPLTLFWLSATSLGIWLMKYLFGLVVIMSLGVALSFPKAFLAQSLALIVDILPLQSIAGLGTFEGAWTAAFVLVGLPQAMAIISGLLGHLLRLAFSAVLALAGGLALLWQMKSNSKPVFPKRL